MKIEVGQLYRDKDKREHRIVKVVGFRHERASQRYVVVARVGTQRKTKIRQDVFEKRFEPCVEPK